MKIKDTFQDYLTYLTAKGLSDKTVREHERLIYGSLAHSISEYEINDLRMTDVAKVMAAGTAHGGYGPQRSVVVLRRLLKYIRESGTPIPFDWHELEVPKVAQKPNEYLTPDELEKVLGALDITDRAGLRTRALLETLWATGMRIAEAISLNKADIDWEKKEAMVKNAKTKDMEMIYFTPRCLDWLKKYLDSRKDDIPAVFVSGRGRMLSVTSRNYIRTHLQNLGIRKHIKHHLFRKTFATHLIQGGADITAVGDLCRHRSPRTTLRYYAAINKERSKEIHQQIMGKKEELDIEHKRII
mgnify:CR=1 FL=1